MTMLRHFAFYLNIFALFLFFPGIFLPLFSLDMTVLAGISGSQLSTELINKELSLLTTVEELWHDQRLLVAVLIFMFSVCIPLLKSILLVVAYLKHEQRIAHKLISFVANIGKWSMADVFVVAIFLAVLSTNHAETTQSQQINLFGFKIDLLISSETLSSVGQGFYFFTAYCIVSLAATQLFQWSIRQSYQQQPQADDLTT